MIFDKIENVKVYPQIPDFVADFIRNVNSQQQTGKVYLVDDKSVWANVDEYTTKPYENCKFEAHKRYIDIQFMLSGEEKIETAFTNELEISDSYDENRDVMFLKDTGNKVILPMKKGYFALFYPTDAHKPQVAFSRPEKVKKVVVKMPL
ncbi:YhcH/YjgK/YiaL family protein [bacterium]|nr:YhcH/YjgK/YiaL family protein [bacterium]